MEMTETAQVVMEAKKEEKEADHQIGRAHV
jgi:hypothetical protein